MSRKIEVNCDRCGKDITSYDIKISSARIDLWGIAIPRSYPGQRIDLCEDCSKDVSPCVLTKTGRMCDSVMEQAEAIYKENYRKQGEGTWEIRKIGDGGTTRTCSNCLITQTVTIYNGKVMFRYCPYCGAKMKGETDGN